MPNYPLYGSALEYQKYKQMLQTEKENAYKQYLMQAQGVAVPELKTRSLLTRVGEVLQTGVYGTAGAAYSIAEGENPFKGLALGLTHQRKKTWSDVLTKTGMKDSHARAIGLALDIVADPITYVPFAGIAKGVGLTKAIKPIGRAAKAIPGVAKLGTGLGKVFGVEQLPRILKEEKYLYTAARESQATIWKGRALELAKKTPMTWEDIAQKTVTDRAMHVLKKGDVLYNPEEWDKIVNILEESKRLPLSTLKQMGYTQEVVHGAGRVKKALREIAEIESKAGIKYKEVERYFPHILAEESILPKEFLSKGPQGTKVSAKFARTRKFPTVEVLTGAGYKTVPAEQAIAARFLAHSRAVTYQNFLHKTLDVEGAALGIHKLNQKSIGSLLGISPKSLRAMPPGKLVEELNLRGLAEYTVELPYKTAAKKYLAPKEIIDNIQRVDKLYSDSPALRTFEYGYDFLLNSWKSLATVVNPGFHFRNTYSNWFNMWLGGVKATNLPNLISKSLLISNTNTKGQIGELSYDVVRGLLKEHGIHGKGWAAMQFVSNPSAILSDIFKQQSKLSKLAPTKWGRWFGGMIEDNARVAMFIDGLTTGKSPIDAAMRVKKYLFDYGELSMVEKKVFRRIIPFYTWMRKNAPLQVEHLWTHTGKYAYIPKVKGAMEGDSQDITPPYFEELYAMKLPESASKWLSKSGLPLYLNPNLPFQDLNRIFDPKDWLNSIGPWKMVFELALNKNIFTGAPLEMQKGQLVSRGWMTTIGPALNFFNFGYITNDAGEKVPALPGKLVHAIETAAPFLRGYGTSALWAAGAAVPGSVVPGEGTKFEETKGWKSLSHLAGIKFIPYNVRREKRAEAYRRRDALRAALYKAKQINPYLVSSMVR